MDGDAGSVDDTPRGVCDFRTDAVAGDENGAMGHVFVSIHNGWWCALLVTARKRFAKEKNLRRALRASERLDVVRGRPVSIRLEEELA